MTGIACERCNDPIETWEDGWVEWLAEPKTPTRYHSHSFRVVHNRNGCFRGDHEYPDRTMRMDHHLSHFIGARGLERFALRALGGGTIDGDSYGRVLLVLLQTVQDKVPSRPSPLDEMHGFASLEEHA